MTTLLGNAIIRIRPDMTGFEAETKRSATTAAKNAAKVAAPFLAGIATAKIGSFFKDSISSASNLQESVNAVNVTFGESADGILSLSENAAKAVGLSKSEFNGLAVQFSNFATTVAGDGGDVTATMQELTGRAADFASVMNMDVADAATLFQSGLAGETEPLRRYGIDVSAAAVQAHALATGIHDGTGEMTEAQKVQARYSLIMEQTNKTAGDFANTSDSLANRQRILSADLEDTRAKIGEALTPAMENLLGVVQEKLLPKLEDFGNWLNEDGVPALEDFAEWLEENSDTVETLAKIVGGAVVAFTAYKVTVALATAALALHNAITRSVTVAKALFTAAVSSNTVAVIANRVAFVASNAIYAAKVGILGAVTVAQWALNAAMLANPIGLVVIAIAALIGALFALYKNNETVRNAIDKAWRVIRDTVKVVLDWLGENIPKAWNAVKDTITGVMDGVKEGVGNALDRVKELFSGAVDAIGKIWEKVTDVVKAPIRAMFEWINSNMIRPINNVLGKFSDSLRLGELPAFADGGPVVGPGTGRSDSILARLSNGEYVMPEDATAKNRPVLDAMRNGAVFTQVQSAAQQGYGIGGPLDWIQDVLAKGATAALSFFATPALDVLEKMFGGSWGPDLVIGGMRNVVNSVLGWARGRDSASGGWDGPPVNIGDLVRPLPRYVVTSEWMRSGADMRHFGIDLGAPTGTPVYSVAAGRVIPVTSANVGATGGYGIMATVDHGGLKTLYAHMSQLAVQVGDIVKKGDLLGRVGSTGQSTGPHLHFETHQPGRGPVNPRSVMAFDSGGYLPPGWSTVFNGTGKPEPVFTDGQWKDMKAKPVNTYNVTISPVTPATPDQVAAALRRVDLIYGG